MEKTKKGNVLIIGNAGVGKSTLINAVLGEEVAETGYGVAGTTKKLKIYGDNEQSPFRIIDTIGFEPSLIKEWRAVKAVKKWSKNCGKEGYENSQINLIWFCVDGTSSKLFPETVKSLSRATAIWKSVPVVVVITKSYSKAEYERNIGMVRDAFAKHGKFSARLKKIIPVVALPYPIDDDMLVPPTGVAELICVTNEELPAGMRAAEQDLAEHLLMRKRAMAQSIVVASVVAASSTGAFAKNGGAGGFLTKLETVEVREIAKVYGIDDDKLLDKIIAVESIGGVAKKIASALGKMDGIAKNLANAVVAGCTTAALGEGAIYICEQIYLGKKSKDEFGWVEDFVQSEFVQKAGNMTEVVSEEIANNKGTVDIAKTIEAYFLSSEDSSLHEE